MPAKIVIDVDGTDAVTTVLLALLNDFPGLDAGRVIRFSTLSETSGIGFFPTSGAALLSDIKDITGHVSQVCQYPFDVIYRAAPKSEDQRIRIKEFLDALGKWLEQQPVLMVDRTADETDPQPTAFRLDSYPSLSAGNRVIRGISRTTPATLSAAYTDGVEDWRISMQLRYDNEFDT